MILADSSIWIDYVRGAQTPKAERLDQLLGRRALLVGDLVLCEVLRGVRREADVTRIRRLLSALPIVSMVGEEVALDAALYYRLLRRRGITIRKTVDLLIGTYCIRHHHQLLHNDRDFLPMVEHLGLVEA